MKSPPKRSGLVLRLVLYTAAFFVARMILLFLLAAAEPSEDSVWPNVLDGALVVLYLVVIFRLYRSTQATSDSTPADLVSQRQRDRSIDQNKAALLGCSWPLLMFIVGFPSLLFIVNLMVRRFGEDLWFPATAIGTVLIMVVYGYFARRQVMVKPVGRVVLWLRRFHEDGLFPFELMLEDVCRGIALPLTVADTTVPGSKLAGEMNPWTIAGAGMIGLAFMGGFATQAVFELNQILVVAIPLGLAGIGVVLWGKRRGGQRDVRTEYGKEELQEIFDAVDRQQPLPSAMTVVRMSDENWKTWVGGFIDRADAVIMDVTHVTDSLGWEMNACRERLPPSSMILACGWYDNAEDDPWPALEPKLTELLGAEFLAGCQRFDYQRPSAGRWRKSVSGLRERLAKRVRDKYEQPLLDRISKAFAARGR